MLSIGEVAQRMEEILGPVADRRAQETGWVQRRSKLTRSTHLQMASQLRKLFESPLRGKGPIGSGSALSSRTAHVTKS